MALKKSAGFGVGILVMALAFLALIISMLGPQFKNIFKNLRQPNSTIVGFTPSTTPSSASRSTTDAHTPVMNHTGVPTTATSSGFANALLPSASANATYVKFNHPYQHNVQPALVYEKFDVTFWINNWDVQPNGNQVRLVIEEMNTKMVEIDELATPHSQYVTSGTQKYSVPTCDTPITVVHDQAYFNKERIPVTGLTEGAYYRLTLKLANADGSLTGVEKSLCAEVNREFLTSLVHVNETKDDGFYKNFYVAPDLISLKQQIVQTKTQLGTIPPCPNHDPMIWHGIYDAVRKCHYNHEHKDDPNRSFYDNPSQGNPGIGTPNTGRGDILSVLGRTWDWLPAQDKSQLPASQTLSYPWQTWAGTDVGALPQGGSMENELKHEGYAWFVRTPDDNGFKKDAGGNKAGRVPECWPMTTGYIDNCITHIRYQIHAVAGMPDALTHTHSFFMEARVCTLDSNDGQDTNKCGIYRGGGHHGFGRLGTTRTSATTPGNQELIPFFWTDGPTTHDVNFSLNPSLPDVYARLDNGLQRPGGIRLHGAMASDDIKANARDFTWYPEGKGGGMVAVLGTSFGPLLYTPKGITYNTSRYHLTGPEWSQIRRQVYYCEDPTRCRWPNGASMEPHFAILRTPKSWDGQAYDEDKQVNGFFTFHGYTNRWGDLLIQGECSNKPLGADCVPTVYDHVPVTDKEAQYRPSSNDIPIYYYDIAPDGEYWIQFPNS
jgi:hypothetical protein